MLDFKKLLGPESLARLEQERSETLRLYRLTNQWLATALLKLAREARKATNYKPDDIVYDAHLVWGLIPELARRLGSVRLEVAEIDWEARALSAYELRQSVGYTLSNTSRHRDTPAWRMLNRAAVHGNPVAFAADRLCAGVPGDKEDPLSRELTDLARVRGVEYAGLWTPEAFMPEELKKL